MASGWRKARIALGLHVCVSAPAAEGSGEIESSASSLSPAGVVSPGSTAHSRSPSRLQLIRTSIRLSRQSSCAICLEHMKPGLGHALFTAECTHTFHFKCISSNVRHGNMVCPVCRARWKEVPWQAPPDAKQEPKVSPRVRRASSTRQPLSLSPRLEDLEAADEELRRLDPVLRILDESIANARGVRRSTSLEPIVFDDDEALETAPATSSSLPEGNTELAGEIVDGGTQSYCSEQDEQVQARPIEVTCHPEVDSICSSEARDDFTVLIHLKAPRHNKDGKAGEAARALTTGGRAPLDLVTVLDVSGSMAGNKLELLKQAMGFVIRNLSPTDRLSVVAFSSTAKRLFPLRRMVEEGRQQALRAVDALLPTGGTNIAEALKKGARILEDRKERNPIASLMLLSDGQDTHNLACRGGLSRGNSLRRSISSGVRHGSTASASSSVYGTVSFPVHTFGFGADHDAGVMHSIAESSGGTFSFIQTEEAVQDAFAQCIGGLLSVVVQDVTLLIHTGLQLVSIQAGSYEQSLSEQGRSGCVKLGDLYAEEERDVLLQLSVPPAVRSKNTQEMGVPSPRSAQLSVPSAVTNKNTQEMELPSAAMKQNTEMVSSPMTNKSAQPPSSITQEMETEILRAECCWKEPVSQRLRRLAPEVLCVRRPSRVCRSKQAVCVKVDRQRNRLRAAQAILEAGSLADRGDLSAAQTVLRDAKAALSSSAAAAAGDALSGALATELSEIEGRMASRQMYERSGRAYTLSAQSCHFRQRATTRGDAVEAESRDYQTPSMADMVLRSQTLSCPESAAAAAAAALASSSSASSRERRSLARKASGRVHDVENRI